MVEDECICCGAELSARFTHRRPVMSSMCTRCTREVDRVQLALRIYGREHRPAVVH
jgi:hypothetical protein